MNESIDELVEKTIKIHPNANKKVLDFIYTFLLASKDVEQVKTIRKQFRAGYCYYFAEMLRIAFNRGEVCWATPYGHMVWMDINGVAYDIEGVNESDVEFYIPISYIGEGIKDFKHIKGEEFNASKDFINSVIERYKKDLKETEMKNKITKELIKNGVEQGIVKIIQSPNDDCIACQIGEYWFYFIGSEDENKTPKEILSSYTQDELCVQIYEAIKGLYIDEQSYYKWYLEEHLKDKDIKKNNKSNKDFVYIVFSGCLGDIGVDAVFKTEDAAKQYIKINTELYEPFYEKYEVLEKCQPKKEQYLTYNVGFINPDTKKDDETQFDVYDFSEIEELFADFAKENHWDKPQIIYINLVEG